MRKDGIGCGLVWSDQTQDKRHDDGESFHRQRLAAPHSAHSNLAVILARFYLNWDLLAPHFNGELRLNRVFSSN